MYLSNRDIHAALVSGQLIIEPRPDVIDNTSVDLHLDRIEEAQVWDLEKYLTEKRVEGLDPLVFN